ncbi:MAG: hypothetical protein BWK80_55585 [Desulfobacteraceae bacterium IS3]|nr:MAG: hypothetical protein BWK80_55585 [Desulfobacteraceae bacterium IS3]
MSQHLTFRAGKSALSIIQEKGLSPDMVKVIAGAAGGPKWLLLHHLDRIIFSSWLTPRTSPLFLVGSSAGAWRFAAAAQKSFEIAGEQFLSAYINQCYDSAPTLQDVAEEMEKIMDAFLNDAGIREILEHPYLRLNVLAVRCKGLGASDKIFPMTLGLGLAVFANLIRRKYLKFFFERALFYDSRDIPPFFEMDEFPIRRIPLNAPNIRQALMASGSIPLIASGVSNIPDAEGMYRDGGVIDYHPDIPFLPEHSSEYSDEESRIVLFPHYTDRIIPGWLDKKLFWRKPSSSHIKNVLLVSPSREFVESLPYSRIPDRQDFKRFQGYDKERIAYWRSVVQRSECLAEEFWDAVQTGKIRERVRELKN